MKVLYIPDIFENGGAYNSFKEMITELNKDYGVEPVILTCTNGEYAKYAIENGYEYHIVKYKQFYIGTDGSKKDLLKKRRLRFLYQIRNALLNERAYIIIKHNININSIDIIHTNVDRNNLGAVLATRLNKPHIWHIREYGELDYNCVPTIKNYIKYMNEHTTRFICISKSIAQYWTKKGLDPNKISIIYNGVSNKYYRVPTQYKSNSDKMNIIMSGNISEEKGQIQLIRALAKLNSEIVHKIHVDIYGNGKESYLNSLKNEIAINNLSDIIEFKGYIQNISDLLSQYDVGIMASKSEAFGRSTIEYMMSGVMVIASNRGANPELISDMRTGLIYKYGDYTDLSKKIEYALSNPIKRKEIATEGKKYAMSHFTSKINAKNIYSLYCELLGK